VLPKFFPIEDELVGQSDQIFSFKLDNKAILGVGQQFQPTLKSVDSEDKEVSGTKRGHGDAYATACE
jgi:hypothetical protein